MFDFDHTIDRRSTNSLKWGRYDKDILPLWVADMDFETPEPVLNALRKNVAHGVFGYEFPTKALLETVAGRMETLYGWKISPDSVLATPGVVSGFVAAAHAVCQEGDGLLVQPPIYPPFLSVSKNLNLVGQEAPLRCDKNRAILNYSIDWDIFNRGINSKEAHSKMLLFCNPHNPTGRDFSTKDLSRIAETCLKNETVICSDEIHSELLMSGTRHTPIASLAPEVEHQTITLLAPSKTFNIAGLFCGFAIIPNPAIREKYKKVLEKMVMHVNSMGLIAAQAALSGECDDWLTALRLYLEGNRDFLVNFVNEEMKWIKTTVPEATYLAWLDCRSAQLPTSPYRHFLESAKVALNDGAEFGKEGEGFVRLNFGCPRKVLEEALTRIRGSLL